jgi:dihydroflavonol-4-reductase
MPKETEKNRYFAKKERMILLTGATGFIGRYLVQELLDQGKALRVLVRNPEGRELPWPEEVEVAEGDVLDVMALEKAMRGVSHVIHAAAIVSFAKSRQEEMKEVNITGTANVVDVALASGVKKLVHISSSSATGRAGRGERVTEESPWQEGVGHSAYGLSKRGAELETYRGLAEGLPCVILNPTVVLGPGDWSQGTPKIFSTVYKGLPFYNRGVTGYVGARDVAWAVRLALESDFQNGERFILSAENLSQQELFSLVARSLGKQPPRYRFPAWLGPPLGWISEKLAALRGTEPIVTRTIMRSANHLTHYSGQKAREQLGVTYTPIAKVIEETGQAFLKAHS